MDKYKIGQILAYEIDLKKEELPDWIKKQLKNRKFETIICGDQSAAGIAPQIDSKPIKAHTIQQFYILQYIQDNFAGGSLALNILDDNTIQATDSIGGQITFYYDGNEVKFK